MFFSSSNSRKHGLDVASQYEVMQRCRRISSVDKAYVREHHTQTWPYWWYGGSVGDWNGWHMGTLGSRSKNLGFYHRETKVQKQVETALKRALSLDGFLHRTHQKYPKKMPKNDAATAASNLLKRSSSINSFSWSIWRLSVLSREPRGTHKTTPEVA